MRTAAMTAKRFTRVYRGDPSEVARVRHDVADLLKNIPRADDAVLIISELATNSIVHSTSRGGMFIVRAETHDGYTWLEAQDSGGPWNPRPDDDRPHGTDIITALVGADEWDTELTAGGDRVTWARLLW